MKIYAPVKDTNGVRASVRFVNGVGETNDPRLIEWFRSHGYGLEESEQVVDVPTNNVGIVILDDEDEDEMMGYAEKTPRLEDMTPNELRELARSTGKGHLIKNTRNKEKLIEILRG